MDNSSGVLLLGTYHSRLDLDPVYTRDERRGVHYIDKYAMLCYDHEALSAFVRFVMEHIAMEAGSDAMHSSHQWLLL